MSNEEEDGTREEKARSCRLGRSWREMDRDRVERRY